MVCAFQPHTYTRTKALFDDFVQALALADLTAALRELARPGDLILTVGAGTVHTAGETLFE